MRDSLEVRVSLGCKLCHQSRVEMLYGMEQVGTRSSFVQ